MTRITKAVWALSMAAALILPGMPSTAQETTAQETTAQETTTQETSSKTERIEELLELTNADALNVQVMDAMVGQFRQTMPEVPDEWWDRFIEKASDADINSLIIPIYESNFSDAEIDAMIAFYQTPEGQSVITKMPMVLQESVAVGQQWGLGIAQEMISELQAEGYEFPTSAPTPAAVPETVPEAVPEAEATPQSETSDSEETPASE